MRWFARWHRGTESHFSCSGGDISAHTGNIASRVEKIRTVDSDYGRFVGNWEADFRLARQSTTTGKKISNMQDYWTN